MKSTLIVLLLWLFPIWSDAQTQDIVIGKAEDIYSSILQEDRILNISLPDGYDKNRAYPVIYLLDGSVDEDFIHVAGLVQYNAFPWVKRIEPSILVGIANKDRKKDFTSPSDNPLDIEYIPNNGGSAQFIAFIEKELQPYIAAQYKTTGEKTLIGQSLGGLLACEILFTKPQLFDKYIIISPSLWWRDNYLMDVNHSVFNNEYTKETSVYIGVGTEGSIDDAVDAMEDDAKKLADKMKREKTRHARIFFDHLVDEDHGTAGHQAILNAFKLFAQ